MGRLYLRVLSFVSCNEMVAGFNLKKSEETCVNIAAVVQSNAVLLVLSLFGVDVM